MRRMVMVLLALSVSGIPAGGSAHGILTATTGAYAAPFDLRSGLGGANSGRGCAATGDHPEGYRKDHRTGLIEMAEGHAVRNCRGHAWMHLWNEWSLGSTPSDLVGKPGTLDLWLLVDPGRTFARGTGSVTGSAVVGLATDAQSVALASARCVRGACTTTSIADGGTRLVRLSLKVARLAETVRLRLNEWWEARGGSGRTEAAASARVLFATVQPA